MVSWIGSVAFRIIEQHVWAWGWLWVGAGWCPIFASFAAFAFVTTFARTLRVGALAVGGRLGGRWCFGEMAIRIVVTFMAGAGRRLHVVEMGSCTGFGRCVTFLALDWWLAWHGSNWASFCGGVGLVR